MNDFSNIKENYRLIEFLIDLKNHSTQKYIQIKELYPNINDNFVIIPRDKAEENYYDAVHEFVITWKKDNSTQFDKCATYIANIPNIHSVFQCSGSLQPVIH